MPARLHVHGIRGRAVPHPQSLRAVNLLAPQHDCALLCIYDINKCSGQVIADALATHSHVILGGRLHENSHYMQPIDFLKKITLRRARAAPVRAPTVQ